MEEKNKAWKILALISIAFIFGFIMGAAYIIAGMSHIIGNIKFQEINMSNEKESFIMDQIRSGIEKNKIIDEKIGLYYNIDDIGKDNVSVFVRDNNTFIKTNQSINLS